MKLPTEAIKEYQELCFDLQGRQVTLAEAEKEAEELLDFLSDVFGRRR